MSRSKMRAQRMPLSATDRFIYLLMILLGVVLAILPSVLFAELAHCVCHAIDPDVIAVSNEAFLYALPLGLVLFTICLLLGCLGIERKQPIFGNKRFRKKWNQVIIEAPSLFSPAFKRCLSEKTKKNVKRVFVLFLVLILISLLILPFGIYSRKTLDRNDYFTAYNSFNCVTHEAMMVEAKELRIKIMRSKNSHFWLELEFVFDAMVYRFPASHLTSGNDAEQMEQLLYLKSLFADGRYQIQNVNRIHRLIYDEQLSEQATALLYELLDYPS